MSFQLKQEIAALNWTVKIIAWPETSTLLLGLFSSSLSRFHFSVGLAEMDWTVDWTVDWTAGTAWEKLGEPFALCSPSSV